MPIGAATSPLAGSHANGPRLLADIGGTNARFALDRGAGLIDTIRVYPCIELASFAHAVAQYLSDAGITGVKHAAVAIANPVDGDLIRMTNHPWSFSIEGTRNQLALDTLLVVNDFAALAMSIPELRENQRMQVGGGTARERGVIGIAGPGTGLGVAALIPLDAGWHALSSEGGHTSFAPADAREDVVMRYAQREFGHVSFERVAAGPAIKLIYRALAADRGAPAAPLGTAEIVASALAGNPAATEALDCFCGILGGFAGNVALMLCAQGGVYIGGGVVPRLGAFFERSPFRARFEDKGRFRTYLSHIPTFVITAEHPAFVGVAAILAEHLRLHGG